MSRYEESKLMEHDGRLEQMSQELQSLREEKQKPRTMAKFKVIAIESKEDLYKSGEAQVNQYLSYGYEIQKDFQTESGAVIVMAKWDNTEVVQKNVHLCTFCPPKEEVTRND